MTAARMEYEIQQAKARIRIAIVRLASKYPFHARVFEQFYLCASPEMATMGVGLSDCEQRLLLYFNPAFVNRILLPELIGVILHEVHHVVFGHIHHDPGEFDDRWARIVAEEVTVNEFVKEPLPGDPITLSLFPELSPNQSTGQRYDILKRQMQRDHITLSPGDESTSSETVAGPVDDHSLWPQDSEEAEIVEVVVQEALEVAAEKSTVDEIPNCFIGALLAQGIGSESGDGTYVFKHNAEAEVPWQRLLRRYTGQCLAADYTLHQPNRRFPELVGVIPGKIRVSNKPKILAAIDCSGSITSQMLESIDAELAVLAKNFSVTVVECDCVIHNVYPYAPLKQVSGRGGTDLRPPLEKSFLRKHRPDLIVYFTDGMGPAPKQPPRQPVIWCIIDRGVVPAQWGRAIRCRQNADSSHGPMPF